MLPAIRGGVRRLRWVVTVLAVIAPVAFPSTASADNGATAESVQYVSTSVAPVSGSDAEYDNQATATQTSNGLTALSVSFKAPLSLATVITANNNATATVNNCTNCTAIAISFQAVLAGQVNLAEVTANDVASASGTNCTNCNTLAEAFQIVFDPQSSRSVYLAVIYLGKLQQQFQALQSAHLSLAQIQNVSTADVTAVVTKLQRAAAADEQVTPALYGSQQQNQLTSVPPVTLLSVFHH
jgi:hypothetical protein